MIEVFWLGCQYKLFLKAVLGEHQSCAIVTLVGTVDG
jgi:hypothetical protein